jgi:hypothetical protein
MAETTGASPTRQARRAATPAEFKAMAHPLRLRILRLCLHDALTNKQIADHLGQDPATILHHVRTLCAAGFLAPDPPRTGARGALEKPYRATRKSWTLSVEGDDEQVTSALAFLDALRGELVQAGPAGIVVNSRLGLRLAPDELVALADRLEDVIEEYAARPPTPGGASVGLHVTLHRQATDEPPPD